MKKIEIDLHESFEKTCDTVLRLPEGRYGRNARPETVAEALRYLYITAHGRALETSMGPITIMPALDPSLADASFPVVTRSDLLALAERRTMFALRPRQNGNSIHSTGRLSRRTIKPSRPVARNRIVSHLSNYSTSSRTRCPVRQPIE